MIHLIATEHSNPPGASDEADDETEQRAGT